MIKPTNNLKEYFYFVNNGVIYNISQINDKDECGKSYILYTIDGEIDYEKNSKIFPNIKIDYKYKDKNGNDITGTKYYWFQNLIKKGDTVTGDGEDVKFETNKQHDTDGDGKKDVEYLDIIKDDILNEISKYIKRNLRNLSVDAIKSKLPIYATVKEGEQINLDGKNVTITSITEGFGGEAEVFTDDYISNLMEEHIKNNILNYGNSLVKQINKEIDELTFKDINGN